MKIDAATALYAVFGNPVSHSLSPVIHNAAFSYTGFNGAYLAFKIEDIRTAVSGIRSLGIQGVSITIPHKVAVMAHLDDIDGMAEQIGAVNTIVNRNGVLKGYNTDAPGAVRALKEKTDIKNRTVAILGAGGSARAVGFGIAAEGGKPVIFNRTVSKGEQLARDLNTDFYPISEFDKKSCSVIINTTSVGMTPNIHASPIPETYLKKETIVMDIVYHPLRTRLLTDARKAGCTVIEGISMFVFQGAIQFHLWTGTEAPADVMKQAALDQLRCAENR